MCIAILIILQLDMYSAAPHGSAWGILYKWIKPGRGVNEGWAGLRSQSQTTPWP